MNSKKLIIIVGPTAVGKTALSVELALKLNCDIISCDSRQFYRELSIGTAKPTLAEMRGVKHHFINSHSVDEYYSAGDYERDVDLLFENYFKQNDYIIMSGGSGLFVKAVLEGLDELPNVSPELRESLMKELNEKGLGYLVEKLKELDIFTYNTIDIQNTQRVVRALEICISTGKPSAEFKKKSAKLLPFETIKIAIERPREELYNRINIRVDEMIKIGLIDEVKNLVKYRNKNALQTVGYKEVFPYLDGEYDFNTMVSLLKRNSRRYAKRQMTWFKNQDKFEWFDAKNSGLIESYILNKIGV